MKKGQVLKSENMISEGQPNDIIRKLTGSDSSEAFYLSLGYIRSTSSDKQHELSNMIAALTANINLITIGSIIQKKEIAIIEMYLGLDLSMNQVDRINKSYPDIKLIHEMHGSDKRFKLCSIEIIGENPGQPLPAEGESNIYCFSKNLNSVIDEIIKKSSERNNDKIIAILKAVNDQADTFHRNNNGIFLSLNSNPHKKIRQEKLLTKRTIPPVSASRRQMAEEKYKSYPSRIRALSEADSQRLIHELEVHQIELEMQIHELELEQAKLEDSLTSYMEIYDFAPIGYLTLSQELEISKFNLLGANMLGKEHLHLLGSCFVNYVSNDSIPILDLFIKKVFASNVKEWCEVTILASNDLPKHVLLSGIAIEDEKKCLMSMTDITEINVVKKGLIVDKEELTYQNDKKQKHAGDI